MKIIDGYYIPGIFNIGTTETSHTITTTSIPNMDYVVTLDNSGVSIGLNQKEPDSVTKLAYDGPYIPDETDSKLDEEKSEEKEKYSDYERLGLIKQRLDSLEKKNIINRSVAENIINIASKLKDSEEIDPKLLDTMINMMDVDKQVLKKDAGPVARKISDVMHDNAEKTRQKQIRNLQDIAKYNKYNSLNNNNGLRRIAEKEQDIAEKLKQMANSIESEFTARLREQEKKSGSKMKKEASRAGNIILAKQLTNISAKVLATQIIPLVDKSDEQNISEFFQTDFGKSLMSFMLGVGLSKSKVNPSGGFLDLAKIAEECRIEGMANAGTLIMDELFEIIVPGVKSMLNFSDQSSDKSRVNELGKENKYIEDEYIEDDFEDRGIEMNTIRK